MDRVGANCGSTALALQKLPVWLGAGKWDLIHFNFGIHDRNTKPEVYAENLETGVKLDLQRLRIDQFDLLGTTAAASAAVIFEVDITTGTEVQINSTPLLNGTWGGVITPDWIAWLDQRTRPECTYFSPCDTEIWGFDRRTRTEAPLVTSPGMHGRDLDGEGEWLAYTDQRDDPNPHDDSDRRQNIYALHLPTMTEIRVEDWPGYQMAPRVYRGVDEWRVLLVEEVSYLPVAMDLWDCSLPGM